MTVLGVTGGSGSGKSTLLEAVRRRGGLCVDCDELYHALLRTDAALLSEIAARFPGSVTGGALRRKALGALVFSDPAALRDLNAITHRAVCREVERILCASDAPLAAVEAIALFESGLAALCDVTVAVTAPEEARVARLIVREGVTRDYALSRIRAQKSDAEFAALADFTLQNNGSPEEFRQSCEKYLDSIGKEHQYGRKNL